MEEFCGSKFWDWHLTWNTTDPQFTPCFEQTALIWVPCGFLWIFAFLDIYQSHKIRECFIIHKSSLNILKFLTTSILILLNAILLLYNIFRRDDVNQFAVHFTSPIIKIITYVLYLALFWYSLQKRRVASGTQFIFWLILLACQAVRWRSIIKQKDFFDTLPFIVEVLYFPVVLLMFFANCWPNVKPPHKRHKPNYQNLEKPCPEAHSSFLSQQLFSWFTGLTWKGYRKPLEIEDIWDLNHCNSSRSIVPQFDKQWKKEVYNANFGKENGSERSKKFDTGSDNVDVKNHYRKKPANAVGAFFKAFVATFAIGSFLRFIPDMLVFVSPKVLGWLITFTGNNDEETWKGFAYAGLQSVTSLFVTLVYLRHNHVMFLTGMRFKTALTSAIYRKALRLSNSSKRESSTGEIVNLMSVDLQKVMDLVPFGNMVWSSPIQIAVALYFLWDILGISVLAGVAVMIVLILVNTFIVAKTRTLQILQMKKKDLRVKLVNEILAGIKVLKLQAWEPSFESQVLKIRKEEEELLKLVAYLNAVTSFLWTCSPFIVTLVTFATYLAVDSKNVLNSNVAFVSLSLFNLMSIPLQAIPIIITLFIQAGVSIKRLNKYMNSEEIDLNSVSHDETETDPIVIENGTFAWKSDSIILHNINLRIKAGSLVAIVGEVGSGKSTLLAAILGELEKISGRVNTKGAMGYVSQQAWIQNATLRNNILFGKPYDSDKYDSIIEACALQPDLSSLPAGDSTEIGEKGVNLSGGQKQRVSLARAVFFDADVYLLDDLLSAVDCHVGKHVFDKVLGPNGILKNKTRVLVTHGIQYLPQVDHIVVLKGGQITESGTYKQLLKQNGAFSEFLREHVNDCLEELAEQDTIQDIEDVVGEIETVARRCRLNSGGCSRRESGRASPTRRVTITEMETKESMELADVKNVLESGEGSKLIQTERMETDGVKWSVYIDYFRYGGWIALILTLVLYGASQGFSIGSSLYLSKWTGKLDDDEDAQGKGEFIGVYGGLIVGQAVMVLFGSFCLAVGTFKSASTLHFGMMQRILRAPLTFFDVTPSGRILNRVGKDVDICDSTIPYTYRLLLGAIFAVASNLFIISYSTPLFIAVIVPLAICYCGIQRFYVSTSRQLKRLESVTRSPIYSHFEDTLTGAATIRAFGEQQRFILESEEKVDLNQSVYYPGVVCLLWLQVRIETIGNLLTLFAAIFAVLSRDNLDQGIVGLSVSYAMQITTGLYLLVRWTADLETHIVCVERIKEYFKLEREALWKKDNLLPHDSSWPEEGEIKFTNYQARYRPGLELVLKNVSCQIKAGEKVGVVGRTGAGKSSLTLALFRILEAAGGEITIDGKNIAKMGVHDLRSRISIIPQDPVLFAGSLRLNLDPFEQYTDDKIWEALESAHLKKFVKSFAAGIQMEIAEGGANLSLGQRSLVCLARVLLRKTKVLIMDEATASLDIETDELIQNTIRTLFKNSTVLTIAHRLSTVMDLDKVMVMDNGQLKEFNTPTKLLQDPDSIFYSMAKEAGLK